jgi:hypothetical protein
MKHLLLILFIVTKCFAQDTLIVHSKKDARFIAYRDSLRSYYSGYKQLEVCKKIKNRMDTSEGSKAMALINSMREKLNPNIEYFILRQDFKFLHSTTKDKYFTHYISWIPELYKKPVRVVLYNKEESVITPSYTTNVCLNKVIKYKFISNGVEITKEEFKKLYSSNLTKKNN